MKRITEPDNLQLEAGRLMPSLILASSSPNRKALLEKGGIHVDTFAPEADESRIGDTPDEKVEGIARRKIMAYISSPAYDENRLAIAADTLVLFGNELLGKPRDRNEADAILHRLSGNKQTVISAAAVKLPGRDAIIISDRADWSTRVEAGSDMTAWLAMARTDLAPFSIIRLAAFVMVPAVSTMSSTSRTSKPLTSPMIRISATSLARKRLL